MAKQKKSFFEKLTGIKKVTEEEAVILEQNDDQQCTDPVEADRDLAELAWFTSCRTHHDPYPFMPNVGLPRRSPLARY